MPIINSSDTHGRYYKWGDHGHKYYYISGNKQSRLIALNKCKRQAKAIEASKYYKNKSK